MATYERAWTNRLQIISRPCAAEYSQQRKSPTLAENAKWGPVFVLPEAGGSLLKLRTRYSCSNTYCDVTVIVAVAVNCVVPLV